MKYLEVTEFDPGVGKEYLVQDYPGKGFYLNKRMGMVFAVYTVGVTSACVICVYSADQVKEMLPAEVSSTPSGSISEDTLLRALAIAQMPTLAKDLLAIRQP